MGTVIGSLVQCSLGAGEAARLSREADHKCVDYVGRS